LHWLLLLFPTILFVIAALAALVRPRPLLNFIDYRSIRSPALLNKAASKGLLVVAILTLGLAALAALEQLPTIPIFFGQVLCLLAGVGWLAVAAGRMGKHS
jgi:hypothetical protein